MASAWKPPERLERYGPGGFVVAGHTFTCAVLLLPGATREWAAASPKSLELADFQPVLDAAGIELLLIGTGKSMQPIPASLRQTLRDAGIVVEAMASAAACRTYGVLLAEGRRVAAALLPLEA